MTYQELRRRLRRLGYKVDRHGARHDIWVNADGTREGPVGRHLGEIPPGTLGEIMRELGLSRRGLGLRS